MSGNSEEPNLFADIDPQMKAPPLSTGAGDSETENLFDDLPKVGQSPRGLVGTLFKSALGSTAPAFAGFAGMGAGAEAGGALGLVASPLLGPAAPGVGAFLGGLAGMFSATSAVQGAQDWAVSKLPYSWQDALGQSEREKQLQEAQHPIGSFVGGTLPFLATMKPGAFTLKSAEVAENATPWARIQANPLMSRALGGAALGGFQLAQDEWEEGTPDWAKVGISTGFGFIWNKPTQFGERLEKLGAKPFEPFTTAATGFATLRAPGDVERPAPPPTEAEPTAQPPAAPSGYDVGSQFPYQWNVPAKGILSHDNPTVSQAWDSGVIGTGTTEATFQGEEERNPAVAASAQNAAATEASLLGPKRIPDIDFEARRIAPEVFSQYDSLLAQKESLTAFLAQHGSVDRLTQLQGELDFWRQAAGDTDHPSTGPEAEQRRAELQTAVDTLKARQAAAPKLYAPSPEETIAQQHLAEIEHQLLDLAPQVASARRSAEDRAGQGVMPGSAAAEAKPGKPIADQIAFIVQDRTAALMHIGYSREEAEHSARVEAQQWRLLSDLSENESAEDLYRAHAADIEGHPVTRAQPQAIPTPSISDIQARDGVSATEAAETQKRELADSQRPVDTTPISPDQAKRQRIIARSNLERAINAPGVTDALKLLQSGQTWQDTYPIVQKALKPQEWKAIADMMVADGHITPAGAKPPITTELQWFVAHDILNPTKQQKKIAATIYENSVALRGDWDKAQRAKQAASSPPVEQAPPAEQTAAASVEPAEPIQQSAPAPAASTEKPRLAFDKDGNVTAESADALAAWQAANPVDKSFAPKRRRVNPELQRLADTAGVDTTETPPQAIVEKVADRLPTEQAVQEANAATEAGEADYREAEAVVAAENPEVLRDLDRLYGADQARDLETLENERRPPNAPSTPEQRPSGSGEQSASPEGERPLPEGSGQSGPIAELGGRAEPEEPTPGAVERGGSDLGADQPIEEPTTTGSAAGSPNDVGTTNTDTGTTAGGALGAERKRDGHGNLIFQKGERVIIPDGQQGAGRHGTVTEANGMVMQSLLGGGRTGSFYQYTVKTDGGWETSVSKLMPETNERPVVPADPVVGRYTMTPDGLRSSIRASKGEAETLENKLRRARTQTSKITLRRAIDEARADAAKKQAVLDAWEAEHGTKPTAATEPSAPTPPTTPGMAMVETRHTKTGEPLFVVTQAARVGDADFTAMRATAKQNGGYYSSFRGRGAVPGWTFKTHADAEAFMRQMGHEAPRVETPSQATEIAAGNQPDLPPPEPIVPGADMTPEQRILSDGIAPAEGKGPLPVTTESPETRVKPEPLVQPAVETPLAEPRPEVSPSTPGYGANNKIFTADKAEAARQRMRDRLNRLNAGFDPEMMLDGLTLAGFHIEAGARSFAAYSRAMVEDLGENIRPFLEHFYNSVRDYPGFDKTGMDSRAEVERLVAEEATQRPAPEPLAGEAAEHLVDIHAGEPVLDTIAEDTARGMTPAEIAEQPGMPFSEAEISGIAEVLENRGEIPEIEGQEDGVQGALPASDEGAGTEDVSGTAPLGEDGSAPSGEIGGGSSTAEGDNGGQAGQRPGTPDGARDGEGAIDRVSDTGARAEPRTAGRPASRPDASVKGTNFTIEPGDLAEARGLKTKARDNLAAIQLAKRLTEEGRPATRAEQAILVKYTGWGGLKGSFEGSDGKFGKGFEDIGKRLKDLMTKEEYDTAATSTQYAHYTAEHVVRSMWQAVRNMGFEGGSVFEPGMGIGHFLGLMPPDLAGKSQYQGIERDHLSASIAKLLYPESGVRQADYFKTPIPPDTFDLVIGNPPFVETVITEDPKYASKHFMMHDYFFAKSLDSVRPGGLLGFISSAGTMNKIDTKAREYLAERAEFVGGIRMPSSTFRQNANTDVTTDILFFKRRPEGVVKLESFPSWTETVVRDLVNREGEPTQGNVNRYFSEHPENVLGEEGMFDKLKAGERYAVHQRPETNLQADLQEAVERLPRDVMEPPQTPGERAALDFDSNQKKDGSYYLAGDGTLMQYRDGAGRPVEGRGTKNATGPTHTAIDRERITHLIPIRDALRDVFAADLADDADRGGAARAQLNEHYDRFVEKFGPINKATFSYRKPTLAQLEEARLEAREEAREAGQYFDDGDFDPEPMLRSNAKISEIAKARDQARQEAVAAGRAFNEGTFDPNEVEDRVTVDRPNIKPFMADPESYRLRSIEEYDDSTGEAKKKDIFFKNIIKREPEGKLNFAHDGILWSMNQFGRFDVDKIAEKMGRDPHGIIEELGDAVFKVPGSEGTYQTRDEYLSGDVVSKLETARAAAERDPEVRRNIEALEAAQPIPVGPQRITMMLGMPWIPQDVLAEFVRDRLQMGTPYLHHSDITGRWIVDTKYVPVEGGATTWGTTDRNGLELLSDALNRTPPRIFKDITDERGNKIRIFDDKATQLALDKYKAIQDAFFDAEARTGWAVAEPERAEKLAQIYNDKLNRTVARQYDGSYLTTPGITSTWQWRPHQTRGIARIIQSGNTYLAHAVGSGKTSEAIGAAMEMRRLGLVKKNLIVVPNHMLSQFTKEFYEQYPLARIAVADEQRFHTDRRRQFVANAAQDDLDAIIMTKASFGKLPVGDEFQNQMIQEQLADYDRALEELAKSGSETRYTRGRIEAQKEALQQKLAKRASNSQDQTINFEHLGADFLFVDEAHEYRKLSFSTVQQNLKGITPDGSAAAWDLYTKVRYLNSKKPGRSVVFMSGTPITNTMGELYSVSRYLQPEALAERGITHFDSWAQSFGNTATELEGTPAGNYQPVTRFRKFMNAPALYNMVSQVMDIVTPGQLEQYVTRPQLQGGQRIFHMAPRTEFLDQYQGKLRDRMEAIKTRKGPPQKGQDILLSVINDGRHAAMDPRFVEEAPNDPRSKLNMMIDNVAEIHNRTTDTQFYTPQSGYKEESFRGPATQMIFANLGVNGRGPMGFSSYQWIKESLKRRGIPADQIAIIGDYKTALQRQALFNDMNEGKIRILIGSTQKMGTGVNAQRRLYALHNLDPLWYPADDEQRVGRILRQGNHNPEIEVHDYTTKGTYDSVMWNMMAKKAGFIEGFFRGDPNLQDLDDLGEASMYEQAAAMSTTDERLITLTQLKQDLDKARRRRDGHQNEQYAIRRKVQQTEWSASSYDRQAATTRQNLETRQDISGDNFKATIGGVDFDKRPEAATAISDIINERGAGLGQGGSTVIGKLGGFPMVLERDGANHLSIGLRMAGGEVRNVRFRFEPQSEGLPKVTGVLQSAEYILRNLDKDLESATANRDKALQQIATLKTQIGLPFTGEAEINRLTDAVSALSQEINEKPVGGTPAAADDTELSQRNRAGKRQASISMTPGERSTVKFFKAKDVTSILHEFSHDWLAQILKRADREGASERLKTEAENIRKWLGVSKDWTGFKPDAKGGVVPDEKPQERWARAFEQYLREGHSPDRELDPALQRLSSWFENIYRARGFVGPIGENDAVVQGIFDRMLAMQPDRVTHGRVPERANSLADIHEADAAHTPGPEKEVAGDRVVAEAEARKNADQDLASDRNAATQPTDSSGETGIRQGGGEGVAPGGTTPAPAPAPGGESVGNGPELRGGGEALPGGGAAQPDRGGELATAERPGGRERPVSGDPTGPGSFAPQSATKLSDKTKTEAVDLAGNIRTRNIRDSQGFVDAAMLSAERNDKYQAVRGRATMGQMIDLANAMGLDPRQITEDQLGKLFGGVEDLGPKIWALRDAIGQQGMTVHELWKTAAESQDPAHIAEAATEMARFDMMMSTLARVTAIQGRNLGMSFKNMENWKQAKDLNQFLKENAGKDLYQIEMIAKLGARMDTPAKVAKLVRDGNKRNFLSMLLECWTNNLISGLSTHSTYVVAGSLLTAQKATAETGAAWALGAVRAALGRQGERVLPGEIGAQFRGGSLPGAVSSAIEAGRTGITTLLPGETQHVANPYLGDTDLALGKSLTNQPVTWAEVSNEAYAAIQGLRDGIIAGAEMATAGKGAVPNAPRFGAIYEPGRAIPNIAMRGVTVAPIGTLARAPSHGVAAIHSFQRALNYSMELNRLAYREAMMEAATAAPGFDVAARIADLRQNPTDEMMEQARGVATDLTLMGQSDRLTQAMNRFLNTEIMGARPLRFISPFATVSSNIIKESIVKRSPVGLLALLGDSELGRDLKGLNGNIAQDTAIGRIIVGTAVATTFGFLAGQGLVNGSGPPSYQQNVTWQAMGNLPHSIRIGDFWYGVNRLGPMGMLMSTSADMYAAGAYLAQGQGDMAAAAIVHAFVMNVLDDSMLRGPADAIKAIMEPGGAGNYVRSQVASFMPYSVGMAQWARAADPYSRQARSMTDELLMHIPYEHELLWAKRDLWGEKTPATIGALDGWTAIYEKRLSTDPVDQAFLKLGFYPGAPGRKIRNVELTDQQYDDYARLAGRAAKMRLDRLVQSRSFQSWGPGQQHDALEYAIKATREAAAGQVMRLYPEIPKAAHQARAQRFASPTE